MRRYTTPTVTIKIKDLNLAGMKTFVTFKQGKKILFTREDLVFVGTETGSQAVATLTQEETGAFNTTERVKIQVRFIDENGDAGATNIVSVDMKPVLMEGAISYG